MSLINQMLKDLDARRSDAAGANHYGSQVRAVPERRGVHPAWWVVLVFGLCLVALLSWIALHAPATGNVASIERPSLKFEASLGEVPTAQAEPPPTQEEVVEASASIPGPLPAPDQVITAPAAHPAEPAGGRTNVVAATQPAAPPPAAPETRTARSAQPAMPAQTVSAETAPAPAPSLALASTSMKAPHPDFAKQVHELTATQRAENEFRKATYSLQQGRQADALAGLEQALRLDPKHVAARQTIIAVLLDANRLDEAFLHARVGQGLDPRELGLAMIFARLQLEKGDLRGAIETLEITRPHALERAEYMAFLAALFQRDERHRQAAEHYLLALQRMPQNGVWWMGLGISLQAEQRHAEAQEAFQRAKTSNGLSPQLQAFVDARLAQLGSLR